MRRFLIVLASMTLLGLAIAATGVSAGGARPGNGGPAPAGDVLPEGG